MFAGLRSIDVGTDTAAYYRIFHYISDSSVNPFFLGYEPGFTLLNILSDALGIGPQGAILISSLAVSFFIMLAANRFSVNNVVFFSIYLGLSFYIFSFNGVRQAVAIAVILNGGKAFSEGSYRFGMFWCLLAMAFHYTAIIFIPFVFFAKSRPSIKFVFLVWLFSFIVMIFPGPLKALLVASSGYFPDKYQTYLSAKIFSMSGSLAMREVFYQLIALVVLFFWNLSTNRFYQFLSLVVISSVIFKNVLFNFGFLARLSLYFEIFIPLYFGFLFDFFSKSYGKWVFSLFFSCFLFLLYFRAIYGNSNGVLPH